MQSVRAFLQPCYGARMCKSKRKREKRRKKDKACYRAGERESWGVADGEARIAFVGVAEDEERFAAL
jgi:hypothetical protein